MVLLQKSAAVRLFGETAQLFAVQIIDIPLAIACRVRGFLFFRATCSEGRRSIESELPQSEKGGELTRPNLVEWGGVAALVGCDDMSSADTTGRIQWSLPQGGRIKLHELRDCYPGRSQPRSIGCAG